MDCTVREGAGGEEGTSMSMSASLPGSLSLSLPSATCTSSATGAGRPAFEQLRHTFAPAGKVDTAALGWLPAFSVLIRHLAPEMCQQVVVYWTYVTAGAAVRATEGAAAATEGATAAGTLRDETLL